MVDYRVWDSLRFDFQGFDARGLTVKDLLGTYRGMDASLTLAPLPIDFEAASLWNSAGVRLRHHTRVNDIYGMPFVTNSFGISIGVSQPTITIEPDYSRLPERSPIWNAALSKQTDEESASTNLTDDIIRVGDTVRFDTHIGSVRSIFENGALLIDGNNDSAFVTVPGQTVKAIPFPEESRFKPGDTVLLTPQEYVGQITHYFPDGAYAFRFDGTPNQVLVQDTAQLIAAKKPTASDRLKLGDTVLDTGFNRVGTVVKLFENGQVRCRMTSASGATSVFFIAKEEKLVRSR